MKTLLDLTNKEAKEFLLKEKSYFSVELPEYFTFQELLNKLDGELEDKELKTCRGAEKIRDLDGVNYKILNNKDGKYSWRPLQLINPAIYVKLVQLITTKEHWTHIKKRFEDFSKNPNIECHSIPVIEEDDDKSIKQNQISEWWQKVEQQSLLLAMEYNHVLHLDLTDCYGSLYTHTIAWAIHKKKKAKGKDSRRDPSLVGNVIDWHLQDMANGQTNGIPQGSVLMDFIAEIVLGYGDECLSIKLGEKKIKNYKIIRYRDDYRIFSNSAEQSALIAKELSEILSELNFKFNNSKTSSNSDLIVGALKPDKLHWIYNKRKTKNIQKWLLQIYQLGDKFPNSGTLYIELKHFLEWLENKENLKELKTSEDKKETADNKKEIKEKKKIQQPDVLISILVQIAYNNPRVYPLVIGAISLLITEIEVVETQKEIIEKIRNKFKQLPNTDYLDVWLQRLTLKIDSGITYSGKLCEKVNHEESEIWNADWLNEGYKKILKDTPVINRGIIDNLKINFSHSEIVLLGESDKMFS